MLELIQPLVDNLNRHFAGPETDFGLAVDYLLDRPVYFPEQVLIHVTVGGDDLLPFQGIAALLKATASQDRILGDGPEESRHLWWPVHFTYVKHVYGTESDENIRYVLCDAQLKYLTPGGATEEEIDQQIISLVAYLNEPGNVPALTAEELSRF